MSIQLNIIGAVYFDRQLKFKKNMEENTQPLICSVVLYTLLCTLYLLLFSPDSSVPLHNQARYLHSFSMLNCVLKTSISFLKLFIISQDLWWHPLPLILTHSCVWQRDFPPPNITKRPTSLVGISFEVSRLKRAELWDRKVLLKHDILKNW